MKTKAFGNGRVGYKVNTIKEVINAQAAGLSICDENGYCFNGVVPEWDDNDDEKDREPTETEVFNRIQEAVNNGTELYATFYLDCGKVVADKATTLQSDFYIDEPVYYMSDNNIALGKIIQIDMAYSKNNRNCKVKKEKYLVYRYGDNGGVIEKKILDEGEVFDSLGGITDYLQCNVKHGEK